MDSGPQGTGAGGGISWKVSVDATSPPALQNSHENDDALTALIMFTMLEQQQNGKNSLSGDTQLKTSLHRYRPRVTDDPLGWGLESLMDQFFQGHPRHATLLALKNEALPPSHLSSPFRLHGALIGARTSNQLRGQKDTTALFNAALELSLNHHQTKAMKKKLEEHSSINRDMLAMCLLCPGA